MIINIYHMFFHQHRAPAEHRYRNRKQRCRHQLNSHQRSLLYHMDYDRLRNIRRFLVRLENRLGYNEILLDNESNLK